MTGIIPVIINHLVNGFAAPMASANLSWKAGAWIQMNLARVLTMVGDLLRSQTTALLPEVIVVVVAGN